MSAYLRKALTVSFGLWARSQRAERAKIQVMLKQAAEYEASMLERYGRRPFADELGMQIGVAPEVAVSLMDQLEIDRILYEKAADSEDCNAAIRKIDQAARCLPPSERTRYRQEWRSELASMPAYQWGSYTLGLLQSAPSLSMVLGKRALRRRRA